MKKIISITLAAFFAASLSFSVIAAENPFGISDLNQGSQLSMSSKAEGKCGGGKCGDGKSGENKCGADKKKESKCGEGKCGADKKKDSKCGEGKCGAN